MDRGISEWWSTDLAKDIHDALKIRESKISPLKGTSTVINSRRPIVEWIGRLCKGLRICRNAHHLSVCLYDRFVENFTVATGELRLISLCCFIIACKFEEKEDNIPTFKLLMERLQWQVAASEYLNTEVRILSSFDWDIGFPTASHFKEFYMRAAIGPNDFHQGLPLVHRERACTHMEQHVSYFMQAYLQDQFFLVFKASLIMAACIASARISLGISPRWTTELQNLSHFTWPHLAPCSAKLLQIFARDKAASEERNRRNATVQQPMAAASSSGATPVAAPLPPQPSVEQSHLDEEYL